MTRLIALGDSLTEGVGDATPQGLRGWIHYLGQEPDIVVVGNFARTGATVADVRQKQLDPALACAAELATCFIGVNDVMSPAFDPSSFSRDFDEVVTALASHCSRAVLVSSLHDIAGAIPLPAKFLSPLRARTAQANEAILHVAKARGALVLDGASSPPLASLKMLSIDRLHPNRSGHRYLAKLALEVLRQNRVLESRSTAEPELESFLERLRGDAQHAAWISKKLWRNAMSRLRRGA